MMRRRGITPDQMASLALIATAVIGLNQAQAADPEPEWWSTGPTPVTNGKIAKNYAPATIGQAKWFAKRALETLDEVSPPLATSIRNDLVGTGKIIPSLDPPQSPTQAWYDDQKKVLLVGQLKAIAQKFYDELNAEASDWLEDEMVLYGTRQAVGLGYYPWSGPTKNYAPANLGQLKAVFALRFTASNDGDDAPDLMEHASLDTTDFPIMAYMDGDGDGTSDIDELKVDLNPVNRDIDGDGQNDLVDTNLFQVVPVRGYNGYISPGVGGQKEFWLNPGESDIELFFFTTDSTTPLTITAESIPPDPPGGPNTPLTATATKFNNSDWEYILKITPTTDWTETISISVKLNGTEVWTDTYLPMRVNELEVSQPVAVDWTDQYKSGPWLEANVYGTGETFPLSRSEGGEYKIDASFDVEGADTGYKLVLIGVPDTDSEEGAAGTKSKSFTPVKVPSFALASSQMRVALVRDSNDEVIYETHVTLGAYGLLTSWDPVYTFDGPTNPSPDPKCAPCSSSATSNETNEHLKKENGTQCAAGYTTHESSSDNKLSSITALGKPNQDGAGQMGFRGNNIGGSDEGGGTLPASQDPAKPDSLHVSASENVEVKMDATDTYPAEVTTAVGVAKVESVVSNGYKIAFYRLPVPMQNDILETRLTVTRPSNTSGQPQELRYIEERFHSTSGTLGSIVETKYSQLVNSDGSEDWVIYEGAEVASVADMDAADEEDFLRKTVIEVSAPRNQLRTEKVTVYEMPANVAASVSNWVAISCVENHHRSYSWGDPIFWRVIDPDGKRLVQSWSYYTESSDGFKRGLPKSYQDYTGYWAEFGWDAHGRLTQAKEPFLDEAPGAADNLCEVVDIVYTGTTAPVSRRETTKIKGTAISENYITGTYLSRSNTRVSTIGGTTGLKTTITRAAVEALSGNQYHDFKATSYKVTAIDYPDGTKLSCTWAYEGTSPNEDQLVRTCERGNSALTRGTKTVTTTDLLGNILETKLYALDFNGSAGSNQHLSTVTLSNLDGLGRPKTTTTSFEDGSTNQVATREYACCGLGKSTDIRGVETEYHFDHLKRLETSTSLGVSQGTQFNGLTRASLRFPKPTSSPHFVDPHVTVRATTYPTDKIVQSSVSYNKAGERMSSLAPSPQHTDGTTMMQTSYSYSYGAGVLTTATYPDGGTSLTQTHRDGRVEGIAGSAVNDRDYEYGTTLTDVTFSNGAIFGRKSIEANGTQWTADMVDLQGRSVLTYYADDSTATRNYTSQGHLDKVVDPDGVTTRFTYNDEGERVFTIRDLDDDGAIDWGSDRISYSQGEYVNAHDTVWDQETPPGRVSGGFAYETESRVYLDSADDSGVWIAPEGLVVSVSQRSIDGLKSWNLPYDDEDRLITSTTALHASEDDWTVTDVVFGERATVSTYNEGLLENVTVKGGGSSTQVVSDVDYEYDDHNRVDRRVDARVGGTKVAFYNNDQLKSSTLEQGAGAGDDLVTAFEYDSMGRQNEVDLPDSDDESGSNLTNITSRTYDERGNVLSVDGGQTYKQGFAYDGLSRLSTLTTYRGTENSGAGTAQVTTWNYDPSRGWLDNKRYADSKGPDYTYTDAGRLETRTWARTDTGEASRVKTTYGYQAGSGDLLTVTYNNDEDDVTPDVTYRYKRWGAIDEVDDVAGTREFSYRETVDLAVDTEEFSTNATTLGGQTVKIAREHSHLYDDEGRMKDLRVGVSADPDQDYLASYTYHSETGRLDTVKHKGGDPFTYAYEGNSHLVSSITGPDFGTDAFTVTNTYETYRDLRTRVLSKKASTVLVDYQYAYNDIGQRDNFIQDGSVFGGGDDSYVLGYNAKGELTRADRHPTPAFGKTSGFNYEYDYAYDPIGNRVSHDVTRSTSSDDHYTYWNAATGTGTAQEGGDELNQYKRMDHQVDSGTPTEYERVHDDDGNLTADGTNAYGWDAENRLIKVTRNSDSKVLAEYRYDYRGRRVWKQTTVDAVQGATERIFIYCGWNLAAEYDASTTSGLSSISSLKRTYTWGLDLSGSLQGAGGVSGLLVMEDHDSPEIFYPLYNANGNVAALMDSAGNNDAYYKFRPFGKAGSSGTYADENPFRFSTKYFDRETEFYYYGYRYYDPAAGRFVNRDPIEEQGGDNLYAFVGNSTLTKIDVLGQGQLWTISGMDSVNNDGQFEDYVGKHLRTNGKKVDWSEHSRLGMFRGGNFICPGGPGFVGHPFSEHVLDKEADTMAKSCCKPSYLCGKKICVVMIAPKTDTLPAKSSCCDITIKTWWNPHDPVPSQGPGSAVESQGRWSLASTLRRN